MKKRLKTTGLGLTFDMHDSLRSERIVLMQIGNLSKLFQMKVHFPYYPLG